MSAVLYLLRGLLAVLGRMLGQVVRGRADLDNRRRELRVQLLVGAWRSMERAASRAGEEEMRGLDQALADVQLFGTPSQADQAARFARSATEGAMETAALDDLLEGLRADLREELSLGRANTRLARRSQRRATVQGRVVVHRGESASERAARSSQVRELS